MTWRMEFVVFCPGGDADICWFFSVLSRVCAIWNSETKENGPDSEELCRFCSDCLRMYKMLLKSYAEELAKKVADPLDLITETTTANSISLTKHLCCGAEMNISDAVLERIEERLEYFNKLAVLKTRSNTMLTYKFGAAELSFVDDKIN